MNYIEMIGQPSTTKTLNYSGNGGDGAYSITPSGAQSYIYDSNTGTAFGVLGYHYSDGWVYITLDFSAEWVGACKIWRIYCISQLQTYGGNYRTDWTPNGQGGYRLYYIQLKINGVWTMIDSYSLTDGLGSNQWGYENYNRDISSGWENVTGIRLHHQHVSYSYEGDRYQHARYYLSELNVYREKYEEVLRLRKNNSTIRIGGHEMTSNHKLRIRDNEMKRGIPLVDATDPLASPIKIYDGSAAKFLPLAD